MAGPEASRANTPLTLAGLAVVFFIAAMIFAPDDDEGVLGLLWPLTGLTGGLAAFLAWRAGRPRPRGKMLLALIVGGLLFALILAWVLVALITGEGF